MWRIAVALTLLVLGGCGSSPSTATVTVFAASSLTEAFNAEAAAFEAENAGVKVRLNFGGSAALASQIEQGASADVFASADIANMNKVKLLGSWRVFANNRLVIAVGAGNPQHIKSPADLADPKLAVVLCVAEVPCGSYARQALHDASVQVTPRSEEQDVKAVLGKVALGEADAGIVYATDARAAHLPDIAINGGPDSAYPVGVPRGAREATLAKRFIDFLLGAKGQAVLTSYGFS